MTPQSQRAAGAYLKSRPSPQFGNLKNFEEKSV
jgi:hypothetical protein